MVSAGAPVLPFLNDELLPGGIKWTIPFPPKLLLVILLDHVTRNPN